MLMSASGGRKRSSSTHRFFSINDSNTLYRCNDAECEFTSQVKHGPSNLKNHLKAKHPEWHQQVETASADEQSAIAKAAKTEARQGRSMEVMMKHEANHIRHGNIHVEGAFATEVEFIAAASLLELDVFIHDSVLPTSNTRQTGWFLYPADLRFNRRTPRGIYLKRIGNCHVDVVLSVSVS
jgi:hypothetical protein